MVLLIVPPGYMRRTTAMPLHLVSSGPVQLLGKVLSGALLFFVHLHLQRPRMNCICLEPRVARSQTSLSVVCISVKCFVMYMPCIKLPTAITIDQHLPC